MRGEYQFPPSIYYKTSAILQQIRYIKSLNLHLNLYTFTTFRALFPFFPFFFKLKIFTGPISRMVCLLYGEIWSPDLPGLDANPV